MAAFDDQKAAVQAAVDELKTAFAAKIADAEQRAADAEKKLQDAADSAVSLDELKAWCDELVTSIKGALG